MNIPDLWSLVTGVASILSLLISLPPNYANWRKYTLPIASFLGGLTFGRISSEFSQSMYAAFQDPYLAVISIFFLATIGLILWVASIMERQNSPQYIYALVLMFLTFGIPGFFNTYSEMNPAIPVQDYLELARIKEHKGDLASAIIYYQKYILKVEDENSKEQVTQKISKLRSRQLNEVNQK